MADQEAAAKKAVEDSAAAQARMVADAEERQNSQPTPTQEENDLAKSGAHVMEKEDDGSGPDRLAGESKEDAKKRADVAASKSKEAKPAPQSGGYQTRASAPKSSSSSTETK
jgi:hypothetical protein